MATPEMPSAHHPAPSSPQYFSRATPPPHTRPLYWTIPLPQIDVSHDHLSSPPSPLYSSSSRSPAPLRSSKPLPSLIQQASRHRDISIVLNPILEQIHLVPCARIQAATSSSATLYSTAPEPPTEWSHESATAPSVKILTLIIDSTGHVITVHPRPRTRAGPRAGLGFVTVKDVLEALSPVFTAVDGSICACRHQDQYSRDNIPRYGCGDISVVPNTLQLCWPTVGSMEDAPLPWNLVIRRRL